MAVLSTCILCSLAQAATAPGRGWERQLHPVQERNPQQLRVQRPMSFPPLVPTPSSGLLLTRGPHLQVLEERVGILLLSPILGHCPPMGTPESPP